MSYQKYNIKFPVTEPHQLGQDEEFFYLIENEQEIQFRFHDYGELYKRPGLYEQLFYERLKCNSPKKVGDILCQVLRDNHIEMTGLRVLDLGAGNGMFGEQLQIVGVARVIGVDISEEAYIACERDRPGLYDAYYVRDFCDLDAVTQQDLATWQIDCLSCVAALGFGDIPAKAFATAFNVIAQSGWVAFNIKESFLLESDISDFSRLIKWLLLNDALEVHHLERYQHRISIDGLPLFYYALVGRKESDIPNHIMASLDHV
ncbi:MAG: methyltransferase domain-containing protein [Methylovulum sp.]|uniref:class I SAM-dependent DNA methyltransferase n=1 Tax=Methylovulum sp. TaxID=1916980 RepID=UPI002605B6F0|nr:methyltransferase domain-containing protein [Methylovulum sp.]MDD2722981.1 methyltransferase domain-containing protein [Methylovulum sp.]MDD5123294.1 methyltransferase domain-containing protein [Methylovulum sp.]